jgi:recombination protein RecA
MPLREITMSKKDETTFDPTILKKEWKDKVKKGKDFKDDQLRHISTGSIKLDWALKRPFIEGSMVEVFGPNAVGKTTLALEVCSNAMKMGKLVFYIDLEYKLREVQLDMIEGFERDKFAILYPDTGEEAMNMMHELMISYPGCVIVLDSVGGLLPEVEDAENFEKQSMGLVARLCHKMIRKLSGINARNKCVTIFLNHLTSTMAMFGKPTTTHGGKAIRNRAAQRIELFAPAAGKIKIGEDVVGQRVRATVIKNNVFRPYIKVTFPIMFGRGIDSELDIIEFARDCGVLAQKGGWYTLEVDGEDKKFREAQLLEMLKNDKEFNTSIREQIAILFE